MQIKKKNLVFAAGCMWLVAGVNVFHIGVKVWQWQHSPLLHFVGVLLTTLFFAFIFQRSYKRNLHRISKLDAPRNPLSFFDLKGWLVIVFMVMLGITVRHFQLLPTHIIAPFYQGLGGCLAVYGGRFLWSGAMMDE